MHQSYRLFFFISILVIGFVFLSPHSVFADNSAPVLDASRTPAMSTVPSFGDAPIGFVGTQISNLIDRVIPAGGLDNVSDPDGIVPIGISIYSVDPSLTCYYSLNGGGVWSALGSPSHASSRLLAADADNRLYCSGPSGTYAIGMRAWDLTSGVDGATASDITNGGTSAFSSTTDDIVLVITPSPYFITTWKTDNSGTSNNDQITIPVGGVGNNFDVDWGDGGMDTDLTTSPTHTYAAPGTYTVKISGTYNGMHFGFGGDKLKLLTVEQWGTDTEWTTMSGAFFGCTNLEINATDAPDLSSVVDMQYAFRGTANLGTADLSNWDVSNVGSFVGTFQDSNFNGDVTNWDVSGATNMSAMFYNDTSFNQDIGNWDVSSATDMNNMFYHDTSFNQDLSSWGVGFVTSMASMFEGATSFDQDLGDWDISHVTSMANMFNGVTLSTLNYDNTLTGWNQTAMGSVVFDGGDSMFCEFVSRHFLEVSNSWTITDGGPDDCDYTIDAVTELEPKVNPGDFVFQYNPSASVHNALYYGYGAMYADVPDCRECNVSFDINTDTATITDLVAGDNVDIQFNFQDLNSHSSNFVEIGPFRVVSSSSSGSRSTLLKPKAVDTPSVSPTVVVPSIVETPYNFTLTLKYKMVGDEVLQLQKYLNTHGFTIALAGVGSKGQETKYFGLLTQQAVKAFQSAHGLLPDGIVGPLTRGKLITNS